MTGQRIPKQVPVFPLPGVVLFPKALLPLKIFEPRYLEMLRDILDSHGCFAMAPSRPGKEECSDAELPTTIGVGRVLEYEHGDDGTYQVILMGEKRARVRGWVGGHPYRLAEVDPLPEEEPEGDEREDLRGRIRRHLHALLEKDGGMDAESRKEIDKAVDSADEVGFLVDSIAFHFIADADEKQTLLEETNAISREKRLKEFLVRHAQIEEDDPPRRRRRKGGRE